MLFSQTIKFEKNRFEPVNVTMSTEELTGKETVKVIKDSSVKEFDEPTFVKIKGTDFKNGTIEVNVLSRLLKDAPDFARGFIGIAFRINDNNSKFECIYLRPTNGRADNQLRRNFLVMACQEWTPQADGYYIIDGKRYNVHIMAINGATFPQPSNNNIEVILQGAPAYNVVMSVSVPANTLSEGSYHVSYGYEPLGINSIRFLRGNTSEDITSDINSEGNMTVVVSGRDYVMDFNGKIKGRTVQIHYSGLVSIQ